MRRYCSRPNHLDGCPVLRWTLCSDSQIAAAKGMRTNSASPATAGVTIASAVRVSRRSFAGGGSAVVGESGGVIEVMRAMSSAGACGWDGEWRRPNHAAAGLAFAVVAVVLVLGVDHLGRLVEQRLGVPAPVGAPERVRELRADDRVRGRDRPRRRHA